MRIVFAAIPAYGHLYPVLPLAMACAAAGHDVAQWHQRGVADALQDVLRQSGHDVFSPARALARRD